MKEAEKCTRGGKEEENEGRSVGDEGWLRGSQERQREANKLCDRQGKAAEGTRGKVMSQGNAKIIIGCLVVEVVSSANQSFPRHRQSFVFTSYCVPLLTRRFVTMHLPYQIS